MEKARRHSVKRDAILSSIRSTDCHPTAEWIYDHLRQELPGLSLATVYRNLAQLRADGSIRSLGTVDGQERYDGNVAPHAHFICRTCGRITDLPPVQVPCPAAAGITAIDGSSVTFYGKCDQCHSAAKEEP